MTAAADPRPETDAPVSPEPADDAQAENAAADADATVAAEEAAAEGADETAEAADASAPGEPAADGSVVASDEPAPADAAPTAPAPGDDEQWGRVDEDGTVSVREAAGWRVVGQYPDGSVEEALAYYERKYADLASEVTLLEVRHRRGGA